ncbi:MAG: glucosaminidase domain-containing protein [Lachnospiraceae bacterium]|nr:glucosaminidase domain-containing protein [Muribaculaceae bacterium]MCM1412328.1 glucosaminidase domain-containing protein [Lachnospiraceae bacterium]
MMKYSDKNAPMVCMMTQGACYKGAGRMQVKGILWHSTGADNPWLKRYVQPDDEAADREKLIAVIGRNSYGNDWNHTDHQAGLNCWVGKLADGTAAAVQTMPWDYRPWGCGSGAKGSCNSGWIQFEICEDGLNDADYFRQVYSEACELTAYLCRKFGIDPKGSVSFNGVEVPTILCHADSHRLGLGSNHGDVLHWFPKFGKDMDSVRNDVAELLREPSGRDDVAVDAGMQAAVLKDLSETDVVRKVGALFTADQKKSGILASVSLAQFILESGYGKSELAQNANNLFGMKCSLSGNTWSGSSWDGKSKYTKKTQEQNKDGGMETITADFRKYSCIEDSIADHSAYLLGAMDGKKLRYEGLKGCADYKKAVQIIKDGGYATSLTYVENLCSIIEKWKLTQYDVEESGSSSDTGIKWYWVRKAWADSKTQKGAYKILDNAKKCADENPGYKVFDADGKVVYEPEAAESAVKVPFLVKVSIKDLNIRKGPGTNYSRVQFIPVGVYTIVEVKSGAGASAWGRLKSGAGWISLDYVRKI